MSIPVSGPGGTYRVFSGDLPTLDQARKLLDQVGPSRPGWSEYVNLNQALGRVLGEDLYAAGDIPPFDRSTVDGYAVRSVDVAQASPSSPVALKWKGQVTMGSGAGQGIGPGEAVAVPTGGMMPAGADAVVMVEHTKADDDTIYVTRPVRQGENVLLRGSDTAAGELLVSAGTRLTPAHIGVLAGSGWVEVPVVPRPVVAIVVTGDELVPPHRDPAGGQIRDMNSYSLAAAVRRDGAVPLLAGRFHDTVDQLAGALEAACRRAQVVLVSGGSSVGVRDVTLGAFQALGARVHLHGIALKPGKPTLIATLGSVLLVGLPGNPVSALVIYDVLVRRAVAKLMGLADEAAPLRISAVLTQGVRRPASREELVRVRLAFDGSEYRAEPVAGTSGMIQSLARASGYVLIPFERDGFQAGERVEVWLAPGGVTC